MEKERYIWLNGEKIYVSEEVYRAYYRPVWREAKQKETRDDMECSYDFMLEHDFDGQAAEDQVLVDEIVADKLLLDELYAALAELTFDERGLIDALYFDEKSERELSSETGVPNPTIHSRKNAVLKKLRKLLEKNS